jgi:hypothetical protein
MGFGLNSFKIIMLAKTKKEMKTNVRIFVYHDATMPAIPQLRFFS